MLRLLHRLTHPGEARRIRELDRPADATAPLLYGPGWNETPEQRAANSRRGA